MPRKRQIVTFRSVISSLGGATAVAREIRQPIATVHQWYHRDSIPAIYWPLLITLAQSRGIEDVTLDVMSRCYARRWPAGVSSKRAG